MCCGSGVHGIVAARCGGAKAVDFVDVNPRALRFAAFNACLNRVRSKCTFYQGDLYDALGSKKNAVYDVIVANPPFVAVPPGGITAKRYPLFSADPSGRGDGVLRDILVGAPRFLRPFIQKSWTGASPKLESASVIGPDIHEEALAPLLKTLTKHNDKATVVIMRGISGSGKTTVAKRIRDTAVKAGRRCISCSADSYFVDKSTGLYAFNRSQLSAAHAECFATFQRALAAPLGHGAPPLIVVDNTNTRRQEYGRYAQRAARCGAEVRVVEVVEGSSGQLAPPPRKGASAFVAMCTSRNVHGAPLDTCAAMHDRWESDPRVVPIPSAVSGAYRRAEHGGIDASSSCGTDTTRRGVVAIVTELPNPESYAQNVLKSLIREHWTSSNGNVEIRASVAHDSPPSAALAYANRRGGAESSPVEAKAWRTLLEREGVGSIANAFVFVGATCADDYVPPMHDAESSSAGDVEGDRSARSPVVNAESFRAPRTWSTTDAESNAVVTVASKFAWSAVATPGEVVCPGPVQGSNT
jgi:hypothetical protein